MQAKKTDPIIADENQGRMREFRFSTLEHAAQNAISAS